MGKSKATLFGATGKILRQFTTTGRCVAFCIARFVSWQHAGHIKAGDSSDRERFDDSAAIAAIARACVPLHASFSEEAVRQLADKSVAICTAMVAFPAHKHIKHITISN